MFKPFVILNKAELAAMSVNIKIEFELQKTKKTKKKTKHVDKSILHSRPKM